MQDEMDWTVKWFRHMASEWEALAVPIAEREFDEGFVAFAHRQRHMWLKFGDDAEKLFWRPVADM